VSEPTQDARRGRAREIARAAVERGEPTAWFEELYSQAAGTDSIPWADLSPNPNFIAWARRENLDGRGRRALKVGAGLGDDAEALSELGFDVVAFDIAPTAIEWARRRFPLSTVDYRVADVLAPPAEWNAAFDFVLEAYTLQVLPAQLRGDAAAAIAATLVPGGSLLVIARAREPDEPEGAMPWPLTNAELRGLFEDHLDLVTLEDYVDDEDPPVRRIRAMFQRSG
jgi:2-polyprenyl-3-methyl-5-hydroxy-6-metoxy-1,4-benzoquinol methylase